MMLQNFRNAAVAFGLATYLMLIWVSPSVAGMMDSRPSGSLDAVSARAVEIEKIQRALENRIVADKLSACGVAPEEVQGKLARMSDDQIHLLAQASDNVLAGGDGIGVVIGVLVIILLVILILKLLNKDIIIK